MTKDEKNKGARMIISEHRPLLLKASNLKINPGYYVLQHVKEDASIY